MALLPVCWFRLSKSENLSQLNVLSSPIFGKVHFDIVMTMIADTLYSDHYCPGGLYSTVFLVAWSTSSGVRRTVTFEKSLQTFSGI
jgi:hypothetical protein